MSRLLILSSWVAAGHVGLSAATPALQALGHAVVALPTVILSNHKAWPAVAGGPVPVGELEAMLEAVAANGWLAGIDAALTGYLPTPDHVAFAARAVARVKSASPAARVVVDPVLGDDPKGLYLPEAAARALRDGLAPLADAIIPNRFELEWLAGAPVRTPAEAVAAARRLGAQEVVVTSPPLGPDGTGLLAVGPEGARLCRAARRASAPHGAGDVLAALVAAGLDAPRAAGMLRALVEASLGAPHLRIAETAATWTAAPPISAEPL